MKRARRPSPALVIALIALFVALGGTSYAALNTLPRNSVGTAQIKNGAVTAAKLRYGGTLPSGRTETGVWGTGGYVGADFGGGYAYPVASFATPLAHAINLSHTIVVSGTSAPHCSGVGHADRRYLCLYVGDISNAPTPTSADTFDPATQNYGAGVNGFGIELVATAVTNQWVVTGSYAVTAP